MTQKVFKSGGRSTEFTAKPDTGKNYALKDIPPGLWRHVRAKAKRQGISLRALILGMLRDWVKS